MDYLKKRATREGCVVDFDKWTFSIQRVRESYFGMPYRLYHTGYTTAIQLWSVSIAGTYILNVQTLQGMMVMFLIC